MRQLADVLERFTGITGGCPTHYTSIYDYVLHTGRYFESQKLTHSEWRLVRRAVVYDRPQQCFANCQRIVLEPLFLDINEIARGEVSALSPFKYVEGFTMGIEVPLPIHHAWLSLNGKVIDPTMRHRRTFKRQAFPDQTMGLMHPHREYYGTVIDWKDVAICIKTNLAWHSVLDDPKGRFPLLSRDKSGDG